MNTDIRGVFERLVDTARTGGAEYGYKDKDELVADMVRAAMSSHGVLESTLATELRLPDNAFATLKLVRTRVADGCATATEKTSTLLFDDVCASFLQDDNFVSPESERIINFWGLQEIEWVI